MSTKADLLDALREEIRTCALFDAPSRPSLPPPHDLDAEQIVLCAMFDGRIRASDTGLEPSAFYAPMHQAIWGAALAADEVGAQLTPLLVVRVLNEQGGRVKECEEAVKRVTDDTPWVYHADRDVERLRMVARQRELLQAMATVDAHIRLQTRPPDDALAVLRQAFGAEGSEPWAS